MKNKMSNDNWVLYFLARQPEWLRSKNQARYRREYCKTLSTDKSKKMFDLLLLKANERNNLEDSEELNAVKQLLRAVDQEKEQARMLMQSRNRTIRLNGGRYVDVIDYTETPPPDEGFFRCLNCGEQVAIDDRKPYSQQSEHKTCPTGVQGHAMMGRGWGGWKSG
jgi:hypothetical protein